MNSVQELGDEIVEHIESKFELDKGKITVATLIGDVIVEEGIDSLDVMELYQELEEKYDCDMNDYEEEKGDFHAMNNAPISELAAYIVRTGGA